MGLTKAEVERHNSRSSCWVVIHGQVYDLTDFLDQHPGGASSILRYGGKDATVEYEPIHPLGTIDTLPKKNHLGPLEGLTREQEVATSPTRPAQQTTNGLPPLRTLQNLDDFRTTAQTSLSKKAWIYYSSAADTLYSDAANRADWAKVSFRPRILRRVDKINTSTIIMGHNSALPIFIAPAALAKLAHEDGELCLGRGARNWNIPYCSSTYSSVAHAEIARAMETDTSERGALLFQLYVPVDKPGAKKLIREARRLKCKALVVTVDSAVIGKREEDDRLKAQLDHEAGIDSAPSMPRPETAPVLRGAHSSTLDWEDLAWIREEWGGAGPLVLKGIQTVEDAVMASKAGVDAIYLSNHGGRQLNYAPSSIRTLLEIRKYCPSILDSGNMDVYLDGGITRGSDAVKALCLGAKAVGIGRPFMYSLSGYGTEGVNRVIEILDDEIQTTMRLLGVTDLKQLSPAYVNASALLNELSNDVDLSTASLHLSSKL